MASPLVSIGLPVYNGARYLRTAIEAALAQDVGDLELIISDNASTDETPVICREYESVDPRVRYLRFETNKGAAWNFNNVAHIASAPYFQWVAHDDVYDSRFVSSCVEQLEQRPDVVLCYSRVVNIDEDGQPMGYQPPAVYATTGTPHERVARFLANPTSCFELLGVIRRLELLETRLIGPYTSSDRTLLLELLLRGTFHQIDQPLAFNRHHRDRSIKRYAARKRNEWFDPGRGGEGALPTWRLLAEYTRAVIGAPISTGEQILSLAHLPGWAVERRRRMVREIGAWVRHHTWGRHRD